MADKLQELKDNFAKISKQTQEAYDKLHGVAGRGGLEQGFLATKKKYDNISDYPEWARADIRSAYEAAKPIYEAALKDYADAQNQKNALRKEVAAAEKAAQTEKESSIKAKSAENVYKKALADLSIAETKLGGYKGQENYVKAYQAAQQAFGDAQKAGKTVAALPEPRIEVPAPLNPIDTQGKDGGTTTEKPLNEVIDFLADPANKTILAKAQADLKRNFPQAYKGPADGKWSIDFQTALGKVAGARQTVPQTVRGTGGILDFIAAPTVDLGFGVSGTGAGTGQPSTVEAIGIWDPTKAESYIQAEATKALGREATADEVAYVTKKLQAAQAKNPTTTTYVVKGGKKTAKTTGGLDEGQFITDLFQTDKKFAEEAAAIKKKAETAKTSAASLVSQDIQKTALNNGITLTPDELSSYEQRVKNGEDVNVIKNNIRSVAALGAPDSVKKILQSGVDLATVYAPYKTALAQTLEINPNSITLNDPTLRMAIGPDKEMSLYEYQRALRQDNRWQYTDQAKQEVGDATQRILKDFGFMG